MTATPPQLEVHPDPSGLIRGLGLWSATAIVIGDTIGTGVFLVSSDMARGTGSAFLVLAAWFAGGIICLFGAFCFAELGAAFPEAGGPYVYLNRGLGRLWGFLFGWMASFLQMPAGMATLAAGFLRFMGFLFPVVGTPPVHGPYRFISLRVDGSAAARSFGDRGCRRRQLFERQHGRHHPGAADLVEGRNNSADHPCRSAVWEGACNGSRPGGHTRDGDVTRLPNRSRSCHVGLLRIQRIG